MNVLKNNSGASFIIFTIMMGAILLALLGAVFGSMYNAQNNARQLRAGINAQLILQQLGVTTLQAYRYNQTGACPAQTSTANHLAFGGAAIFCFPDIGPGADNNGICVPHPIDGATLLCENDAVPMFQPMAVAQGVASFDVELPFAQKLDYFVLKLQRKSHDLIKHLIAKSKYLSDKLDAEVAIPVDFSVAAPTPSTLDVQCIGTRCKECSLNPGGAPTATELPCMRFRVCPHYGGCDPLNANEWIVQKVGILVDAAAPL